MYPPSHLGKEEEQYKQTTGTAQAGANMGRRRGGTVLNTAPLAKAMAASDNAEIQLKAKTGGQKIQEICKMS